MDNILVADDHNEMFFKCEKNALKGYECGHVITIFPHIRLTIEILFISWERAGSQNYQRIGIKTSRRLQVPIQPMIVQKNTEYLNITGL